MLLISAHTTFGGWAHDVRNAAKAHSEVSMLGDFCEPRSDNYCDRIRCYPDFHLQPPVND